MLNWLDSISQKNDVSVHTELALAANDLHLKGLHPFAINDIIIFAVCDHFIKKKHANVGAKCDRCRKYKRNNK